MAKFYEPAVKPMRGPRLDSLQRPDQIGLSEHSSGRLSSQCRRKHVRNRRRMAIQNQAHRDLISKIRVRAMQPHSNMFFGLQNLG